MTGVPAALSCPHRPPCPACPRFGSPGIDPAARNALRTLAEHHGLSGVGEIEGAAAGFRSRARLAIRGRLNTPKLGVFESGTHRVVHIPNCLVHHPLINRVASVVRRALVESKTSSYSESAHLGVARYLQVVVERSSQSAQVVLVANSPAPEPLQDCFELIRARLGSDLHSLWFNANQGTGNVILGPEFRVMHGAECVVEHFGAAAIHYPPGAFGQSNLEIAGRIIAHLRERIPRGARVAEFYAGVGAIGLSLLPEVGELQLNEVSPHSLHGLELGLAALPAQERAKVRVIAGSAGAAAAAAAGAEVVIADPPRKGLDEELTAYLVRHPPARFLYVSCGLDSLLRDTAALTATRTLRLTALTAFNLLPFTGHVETVACFDA
jgi:23S rRNA (uracil1939-C5)-methyltransferase